MTTTSPTTKAELHALLKSTVRAAATNGVAVEGGYDCFATDDQPSWDFEITRVELRSG